MRFYHILFFLVLLNSNLNAQDAYYEDESRYSDNISLSEIIPKEPYAIKVELPYGLDEGILMYSIFKLVRNKRFSNDGYYCKANITDKYGYRNLSLVGPVFYFEESIVEEIKKYKTLDDFYYSLYGLEIREYMENCINNGFEECTVTENLVFPPPPPPPPSYYSEIEEIEDEVEIEETVIESTETYYDNEIEEVEEVEEVPFSLVEDVPVFPGCENKNNNEARKKCMSEKITQIVVRRFNTDLAGDLGLSGRQRILVIFKIDKSGYITDIRARAPHPRLEKEAKRVIGLIPRMKPGKQRGQAVIVPYSLPIIFTVQD
jgi:protein TonB